MLQIKNVFELKNLIDSGVAVYYENTTYKCFKTESGEYMIKCLANNHVTPLEAFTKPETISQYYTTFNQL